MFDIQTFSKIIKMETNKLPRQFFSRLARPMATQLQFICDDLKINFAEIKSNSSDPTDLPRVSSKMLDMMKTQRTYIRTYADFRKAFLAHCADADSVELIKLMDAEMGFEQSVSPPPAVPSATCSVCMDKSITHFIIPCGHACLCDNCATQDYSQIGCPLCRTKITKINKLFSV